MLYPQLYQISTFLSVVIFVFRPFDSVTSMSSGNLAEQCQTSWARVKPEWRTIFGLSEIGTLCGASETFEKPLNLSTKMAAQDPLLINFLMRYHWRIYLHPCWIWCPPASCLGFKRAPFFNVVTMDLGLRWSQVSRLDHFFLNYSNLWTSSKVASWEPPIADVSPSSSKNIWGW